MLAAVGAAGGILESRQGAEGVPNVGRLSSALRHTSFQILMAALGIAPHGLSNLQMRKLKLRDMKYLVWGHTAFK